MSRTAVNWVLGAVLASLVALDWFGARDFGETNWTWLPNMERTARYNAFEPNPNFADGLTLQPPPAGTIPRGMAPFPFEATPQDAIRAALTLKNPIDATADPAALERGTTLFARFCQPCHGPGGAGDGPVAKRGFPPPPSLSAEHARLMQDGQVFHVITLGQGNMPGYAAQIDPDDRWRIVLAMRKLQGQAPAPAAAASAAPAPTPAQGQTAAPAPTTP